MKKILRAFLPFLTEITHDFMLMACLVGPVIAGMVFHFGIPWLEAFLCDYYGKTQMIAPYFAIFDMLLIILTPIMFCFAGVMVILEECDLGVAKYYVVTPLGKSGYIISRIALPALFSFFFDLLLVWVLGVSHMNLFMIFLLSLGGGMLAVLTSLMVVALAGNKMEGMAIIKLCGIVILGIPVAYFVADPVRYLFGIFPSFWMAELCIQKNYIYFCPMIVSSALLTGCFYGKFKKKLL